MKPGIDHTAVAVMFLCHDGNGRMLLQKRGLQARDHQGEWEEGGGALEFGESPEEAVLRELKEEFGCAGLLEEALPVYSIVRETVDGKSHWLGIPFIVRINPEEVQRDKDVVEEVGWFHMNELPTPRHPGFQITLDRYKEQLNKYFHS